MRKGGECTLMTSNSKQSFFEDFILLVPEGKGGTHILMGIRDTADAVLTLGHQKMCHMGEVTQR